MGANEKEQLMVGTIHIGSNTRKYRSGKWSNVHIPNISLSRMSRYYLNVSIRFLRICLVRTPMDEG